MTADRGAAAGFAAALHELYAAAGSPKYATLMRQAGIQSPPAKLTAASLSDWLNGVSVPSSPAALTFLVGYLRPRVPGDAGHRSRSDAWWEARRAEAERERHAARGGRPKQPRDEPRVIVNLPYRATGRFVGREPELDELDAASAAPGAVIVQVVHGLGGVGKSALAAHWAATHTAGFAVVWWITADTSALLDEGLADLAVALDPASAGRGLRELTERAVAWLAAHESWLLILDNVARPADVEPLLSRLRGGRVLITSRLAGGWHPLAASVVRLDVLWPAQAVAMLAGVATGGSGAEVDGAEELCAEPGRAIGHHERALAACTRHLGPDHPDTLGARHNLAAACASAGELARAIELYERTVDDRQRVLGADHPDTLGSRNNLAYAYQAAGDLQQAIPLFERTLADQVRVLGEDHPDTLGSRNNLAYVYQADGDPRRAIPLFERSLADHTRVLGGDDPRTLTTRNNLAIAYVLAGDPGRAIPLLEQNLRDRERVLGPRHPDTLDSRRRLATARGRR